MKQWFDAQLKGPNGEGMSSDEAELGCKMILSEDKALQGYIENARAKVKK